MSDGVCSQFVLHAWKVDICANCLKPRLKHANCTDDSVPSQQCCSSPPPAAVSKQPDVKLSEATNLTTSSVAKPSPVKPKPTISAKPEKPRKKPCLGANQSIIKPGDTQSAEQSSAKHLAPSQLKNVALITSSESQVTDSISSSAEASTVVCGKEIRDDGENETCSNAKTFHHYDVYDVSARELSGFPSELDVNNRATRKDETVGKSLVSEEHGNFQTLPRATDIAEEHVAMPYNVVDVTVRRPLPSNIPQDSNMVLSTTTPTSTWPSKPQPAKRQTASPNQNQPKPRERITLTKEQSACSSSVDISTALDNVNKALPSDLVSERYAHRIYEEIDDLEVGRNTETANPNSTRSSAGKSPAFEAKMAALASLDLGKGGKPVATVTPSPNPPEVSSVDATSGEDGAVVPFARPEKTRKSGGKTTFFKKFFKFGSKDVSPETEQSSAPKSSDGASMKVTQSCEGPFPPSTNACEDAKTSEDAVVPQAAPLTEQQAVLISLKDRLAKRQTSVGVDSGEGSPIHARMQPSDSSVQKSSIESDSDVLRCSTVDKSEQRDAETAPVSDSQTDIHPIQREPSSKDAVVSPPYPQILEIANGDEAVKATEGQLLEVKDLTVVTDDGGGNLDCSMSICSSEAISPTPSDLSVDASDHHSLKRKSRSDRQGSMCIFFKISNKNTAFGIRTEIFVK